MSNDIIEQLIKDQETVVNKDLKAALKQFEKEQSEKRQKELLNEFKEVQAILDYSVQELREVRKREKLAKSKVEIINKAKEQFTKDGNYQNFVDTLHKAGFNPRRY